MVENDDIEEMLWRLELADLPREEQLRRLLNVDGHMGRLVRRNPPEAFAQWLRARDFRAHGEKPITRLMMGDLPMYIAWLQRLHDAYMQTPDQSLFTELLTDGEDA